MSKRLYHNSLNYAANFRLYLASNMAGESVHQILVKALNSPIVLGGTFSARKDEVLAEIADSFDYSGDNGSHPNLEFIGSDEHKELKTKILRNIEVFVEGAEQIIGFWLVGGHPFYPVFCDHAYIIEVQTDAFVLMGSSSD